jgi:hypothetical protein
MPSKPPSEIDWIHKGRVIVPGPGDLMGIRRTDWVRIRRRVRDLTGRTKGVPRLDVIYSILFGVSGTAALSIYPISLTVSLTQNAPPWIVPLYWIVTIFSLAGAILCVALDRGLSKARDDQATEIDQDMEEIERPFSAGS